MSAKHTPGPWAVDPLKQGILGVSTADGDQCVAQAQQIYGDDRKQSRREANARLIAAAPDLLSALKDAMRSSRKDFKHGPDGARQHREAYAEQFAAIAKAEGRS